MTNIMWMVIIIVCAALFYIYLLWLFIKSAISKGVETGIYNAVVELENNGVLEEIMAEKYSIKNKFDKDIPPEDYTSKKRKTKTDSVDEELKNW